MKELKRCIIPLIFTIVVLVMFFNINKIKGNTNSDNAGLVIYGDNIKTNYEPFVKDGGLYISVDTISKTIDKNIYYDTVATKVIVTTDDKVVKLKIDENKLSKNFEYVDIDTPARIVNGQPYIDINLLKEEYNIKTEYNDKTNTIVVDKLSTSDIPVNYNLVNVYSDISTKSDVLDMLNTSDKVTVYADSLEHKSWYKVKTDKGVVGYISKNNITLPDGSLPESNEEQVGENANKDKIVMFWQYGSNLNTLGDKKIEGVNVVSPTWYELKNTSGEIISKFSSSYYSKAKEYGYKIWPIITNGIDSTNYSASDTSALLKSEYNREKFIKNIRDIAKKDKLDGINIDFESMKDEDRDLYTQFIRELTPILRNEGITVSVDFYFVRYIDRQRIGEAVDYVALMGYDQKGSWSNEAGSISKVSEVENQINSLINDSKIPSDKIILGVPFYTRLWTVKNATEKPSSKIYSMQDCQDFLSRNDVATVWDEDAGQNYAEVVKGELTYKLWLEDKESMRKRVELVNKYNLAGISAWQKGLETSDTWQVITGNLK
ncbi:putative glycosyl hydrolase [Clostridium sp. CAG:465]|nr:putative glycosyl hydrolase [Clostridium sp. CAG:465]